MTFAAALALGEGLGFAMSGAPFLWPVALALALLLALGGYGLGFRAWPWAFLFALGAALALRSSAHRMDILDRWCELGGGKAGVFAVEGAVRTFDGKNGPGCSFPSSLEGMRVTVRIETLAEGLEAPRPGEKWEAAGWLERGGALFGGRPRIFRVRGRGSFARRVSGGGGFSGFLLRLRGDLSRRAGIGLDHDEAAADINRSMLLGERSRIPASTRAVFADAGTVHLFAISGLHVLFIARLLCSLFALFRLPLRWMGVAALPALWLYVALAGASPSAVRAAMMASVHMAAPVFWRKPNGWTSWAVAFLLTAFAAPEKMFFDVGCSLSFTVMLALVAWGRWSAPLKSRAVAILGVPFVAWAAGVPIAAHVFGRLSPAGLVANLIAVPAAALGVASSALGIVASAISDHLAAHFNNFAALATSFTAGVSMCAAAIPGAAGRVEPWPIAYCALWYMALAAGLLAVRAYTLRRRTI